MKTQDISVCSDRLMAIHKAVVETSVDPDMKVHHNSNICNQILLMRLV